MHIKTCTLLSLFFVLGIYAQAQVQVNGIKYSLQSEVLEEERFFNVYLPPSYYENASQDYPVLYLMDGDYNFMYVTGLVEQLSAISQKIPEMIVVGISDVGHDAYVKNCTPKDSKINPDGRSEFFLEFLTKELKPFIDEGYQTSSFDFLVGQSLGGLFVVNTLLTDPANFRNYIAISPSLWWNDYSTKDSVEDFFETHENLDESLFLSVGSEKGMGVLGFADQMDVGEFADAYFKNVPLGLRYRFEQYPDENHNSVGLVSISDALKWIFDGYELSSQAWAEIDSFEKYIGHIAPFKRMIGAGYTMPEDQLSVFAKKSMTEGVDSQTAIIEFLTTEIPASLADYYRLLGDAYLAADDADTAIKHLRKSMEINPDMSKVYTSLAKSFESKKDQGMSKHYREKALETAELHFARSWYLNQLKSDIPKQ